MLARFAKALAALAFGFLLLGALEAALRVAGVGDELPRSDPFSGFSSEVPMFEPARRSDGTEIFRLSPLRVPNARWQYEAEPQREFLAHKPEDGFRIFVVGGSSAAGVPYPTNYAFSSWLERRLEAALPQKQIEVVNAALSGYASRRLLPVVREIARYQPDLLILYMGHNEWAERQYYAHLIDMDPRLFALWEWTTSQRLYRLISYLLKGDASQASESIPQIETDARKNSQQMFAVRMGRAAGEGYATARDLEYRDLLYGFNLVEMAKVMHAAGARVMFLSLSQNFADWSPGASAHREDLGAQDAAEWDRAFAEGTRAAERGDCEAALTAYARALEIDDRFAALHYRIAACERALGRYADAREHYRRSSDLDQVPHGAPTSFNQMLREIAADQDAIFVDVDGSLEASSENGLVGGAWFVDFVHPNLLAHQHIAAIVAEAMKREGIPAPAADWRDAPYRDPDPAELYRRQPLLKIRELEVQLFSCQLALRDACIDDKVRALLSLDPENPAANAARSTRARRRG